MQLQTNLTNLKKNSLKLYTCKILVLISRRTEVLNKFFSSVNCLFSFKFQVISENTGLIVVYAPKQILSAVNQCKFSFYELKLFRILLTKPVHERKADIFVYFNSA